DSAVAALLPGSLSGAAGSQPPFRSAPLRVACSGSQSPAAAFYSQLDLCLLVRDLHDRPAVADRQYRAAETAPALPVGAGHRLDPVRKRSGHGVEFGWAGLLRIAVPRRQRLRRSPAADQGNRRALAAIVSRPSCAISIYRRDDAGPAVACARGNRFSRL